MAPSGSAIDFAEEFPINISKRNMTSSVVSTLQARSFNISLVNAGKAS